MVMGVLSFCDGGMFLCHVALVKVASRVNNKPVFIVLLMMSEGHKCFNLCCCPSSHVEKKQIIR